MRIYTITLFAVYEFFDSNETNKDNYSEYIDADGQQLKAINDIIIVLRHLWFNFFSFLIFIVSVVERENM